MPKLPMPFGQGLDRETGVMAMRPGTFEDLRNVLLHQGKAIVRPGFNKTLDILDDEGNQVSHILQGHALRSERVGVVVSYQSTTEKVWIHRIDTAGSTAELIGEWVHDLGGWGSTAPIISMAESYGRVFMAHDERNVLARAPTIYYDPIFGASPLNDLEGDFEGAGTHKIRFRGVRRHLAYLFGWGYGDENEDRPELVRSSAAGDPTTFSPNHYFQAGDRRDPVFNCVPAGARLVVLKETESQVIVGEGRDNFGIFPLDPLYGSINGALAVNFSGLVLAWSSEGPRVYDGSGPSQEISIPLDLGGLEPSDLIAQGDSDRAFAHYIPTLRVVTFVFGQRVFALTVRVEGDWKWSYWELGFTPYCGFTLYPGQQLATAPTGYPVYTAAVASGEWADITFNNVDQAGDETVEIWLRDQAGGDWFLAESSLVATTLAQTVRADHPDMDPGEVFDLAMRYRRGVLYNPAYTSSDPEDWPSVSRGTLTMGINAPLITAGVWSRTGASTEQVELTITPGVGVEANDIEVFRDDVSIGTITGPHAGDVTFTDTSPTGETEHTYHAVTNGSGIDSPPSPDLDVWVGPPGQPVIEWIQGLNDSRYELGFTTPDPTLETEIHDTYDDAGGVGSFALRDTELAGDDSYITPNLSAVPAYPGLTIDVKVRQKATAFSVDDYSPFSLVSSPTIASTYS